MRDHKFVSFVVVLVLLIAAAPHADRVQGQGQGGSCEALVAEALSDLGTNCAGLGPDGICYGFSEVSASTVPEATVPAGFFDAPGDQADLSIIESVSGSVFSTASNQWGIAAMRLQADTKSASVNQSTVYLALGDVELVNLVEPADTPGRSRATIAPMQEFELRTGTDSVECPSVPPSSLVVQVTRNQPVIIKPNDVPIKIDSTIILRSPSENEMQVITGNGTAWLFPGSGNEVEIPAGVSVDVLLGEDEITWTNWRVMSQPEWQRYDDLEDVPQNIFPEGYNNPEIIIPSGVGQPQPQVQLPSGVTRPTPPTGVPFPVIAMRRGAPGRALDRTAWSPFEVGAEICADWTLFQSNRDNNWDILRLDVSAGGALTNLTDNSQNADIEPTFSPDGEWVAFISNRDPMGSWEIYITDAQTGMDARRVTFNTAIDVNPVWGPGNQLVFESNRDRNWELYLFDVDGDGVPVRLTDNDANDLGAYWYPDGQRIVFESDRDGDWELYELNVNTGDLTQLTDNDTRDRMPIISHDGSQIAWLQTDDEGIENLWMMDTASGATTQLTDSGLDVNGHIFSPDDSLIAYHQRDSMRGDYEVYAVRVDSGQIDALTNNAVNDMSPTFWCQTSGVIYQSIVADQPGRPGQYDLFIVDPLPTGGAGVPTRLITEPNADDIFAESDPRTEANSRPNLILPGPLQ